MIIMNLSVAAVIDGLSSARKDNTGIIKKDEINELVELWAEYDPKASGWIDVNDLVFLLFELHEPLGHNGKFNDKNKIKVEENEQSLDVSNIIDQARIENEKMRDNLIAGNFTKLPGISNSISESHEIKLRRISTIRDLDKSK